MKKVLFAVTLFTIFFANNIFSATPASGSGRTTRYWDACMPSCAWPGKASVTCAGCNVSGVKQNPSGWGSGTNSCEGGHIYTCLGQAPWAVSNTLSYGFAATHSDGDCGKCFKLQFTSGLNGKEMIVMVSNIGGDVAGHQFDLMIPGGGVGIFKDAFPRQLQHFNVNDNLGDPYGGFRKDCGNDPACVRRKCDQNFGAPGLENLKNGCYWYIDWFNIADNPNVNFTQVDCPAELRSVFVDGVGGGGPGPDPTTYTITFDANGGSVTPTSSTTGTNGRLTSLPNATRSGYSFGGWYTSATGGQQVTTSHTFSANTTIYARWTTLPTYTITFNPNGTGASVTPTSGVTGTDGKLTSLPTPVRSGYSFTGWYTAGTGGLEVTTSYVFSANATIYARWTQNQGSTFTITFNANGGNVTPTSATTGTNGRLTSLPNPTRSGYTFTGWYTAASGGQEVTTSYTFSANATIYARWNQNQGSTYTITFNPNSSSATVTPTSGTTGTDGKLASLPTPVRNGYSFVGWFTAASGGLEVTTSYVFSANATIYARWTQNQAGTYTITFNANGGSVTPTSAATGTNGRLTSLPTPTRNGYTFNGWYTSATSGQEVTTSHVFSSNATIYARWTQNNGDNNRTDTTKVEAENSTVSLPTCTGNGSPMCKESPNNDGVTNVGYISNGSSLSYTVNIARAGAFTMQFRVATETSPSASFSVSVNNSPAGTVEFNSTGGWQRYEIVTLGSDVQLNQGQNTIVLNFNSPMNIDYFLLLGEKGGQSVDRFGGARTYRTRSNVVIRPINNGFSATLPSGHGFFSYSLIDLQGREIRKGTMNAATTELNFGDMKPGIMFLRLNGKNGVITLRATTF